MKTLWKIMNIEFNIIFTAITIIVFLLADIVVTVWGTHSHLYLLTFGTLFLTIILSLVCAYFMHNRDNQLMATYKLPFFIGIFSLIISLIVVINQYA